ncbi:MAG: ACT domain-containing protein [Thermoplasmata archaeon]|nr:ACT domain-containing protein [Thermoplasmata archaeon]
MKEFDVFVQNKPGELAKICEVLGSNGVNIKAIASERQHSRPQIRIVTDDEATTKSSLKKVGVSFELKNVLTVSLSDRPGELGKMARRLAKAMVNVDSIYIISKENGMTEMALTVDNLKKAKEALR